MDHTEALIMTDKYLVTERRLQKESIRYYKFRKSYFIKHTEMRKSIQEIMKDVIEN